MKKFLLCMAVITALIMTGGRAIAVPVYFGDGGVSLQGALNNVTLGPNPGVSSVDVLTDAISGDADSYWAIHATGGSVNTLLIEIAAWASTNTFGIYDSANPSNTVQIFDGGATSGQQALLSILADGSVIINFVDTGIDFTVNGFGYYLDSSDAHDPWEGGIWYSDTSLNADGEDHMYAYQGKGIDTIQILPYIPGIWDTDEFVLAFEELHSKHWGDQNGINDGFSEWSDVEPDFSDFVVMVESVDSTSVPEPSTIFLIAGLVCVVLGINRKKFMA